MACFVTHNPKRHFPTVASSVLRSRLRGLPSTAVRLIALNDRELNVLPTLGLAAPVNGQRDLSPVPETPTSIQSSCRRFQQDLDDLVAVIWDNNCRLDPQHHQNQHGMCGGDTYSETNYAPPGDIDLRG